MRFSKVVVAALSAPLCVDGNPKDEPVEETKVPSFDAMHSGNEEIRTSMDDALMAVPFVWDDDGDLVPIDFDAWTQATELRNPEYEIDHASHVDEDEVDDDFAVDIGRLSQDCASYPVVNETGELDSEDFHYLVSNCYSNSPSLDDCPDEYSVGLHCWNTSLITDLSYAFHFLYYFNDDISSWDTSKVTSLSDTFFQAYEFNSDISSWDTGNVTSLKRTFYSAYFFNSDMSSWDTGKVTDLTETFKATVYFNSDISSWDTSKVTNMARTFSWAADFNSDISSWDTGKVTSLDGTFAFSSFNSDISSWDTGNVTSLYGTFKSAKRFNSDISSWDTGKVTSLYETFYNAYSFNADISSWDTGNVRSLRKTFRDAWKFNVDISSWDTGNVFRMEYMFYGATEFNQCLGSWAAKTPSTVDTNTMLYDTACPNQSDPDPKKGPWCQGFEERCFGACSDAEDFRFGKNDRKSCDSINEITASTKEKLKKKIRRVCKRKAFRHEEEATTGKKAIRVKDVCQEACGSRGFGPGKKCDKFS